MRSFLNEILIALTSPVAIAGVITAIISVLVGTAWQKWRDRMVVIRWSAQHYFYGPFANVSPALGKVEMRLNDLAVDSLHWIQVEVENESGSRDLANVEMHIDSAPGTTILSAGMMEPALPYKWSERIQTAINQLQGDDDRNAEAWQILRTSREYVIPVFNRGDKIRFTFFVGPPKMGNARLEFSCRAVGVTVREEPVSARVYGVTVKYAIWSGLFASLAISLVAVLFVPYPSLVALIALVAGAYLQLLGAGVVKLKRLIVRTLG